MRYNRVQIFCRKSIFGFLFLLVAFCPAALAVQDANPIFTEKELAWLKSHPEVTLVINNGPKPVSFWNDKSGLQDKTDRRPQMPQYQDTNLKQGTDRNQNQRSSDFRRPLRNQESSEDFGPQRQFRNQRPDQVGPPFRREEESGEQQQGPPRDQRRQQFDDQRPEHGPPPFQRQQQYGEQRQGPPRDQGQRQFNDQQLGPPPFQRQQQSDDLRQQQEQPQQQTNRQTQSQQQEQMQRPFQSQKSDREPGRFVKVTDSQQLEFKGIAADYLKEIEIITGSRFKIKFASHSNRLATYNALEKGDVDLFPSLITGLRKTNQFQTTKPYIRIPIVIVMRDGSPHIDDLRKLTSMKVAGVISAQPKLRKAGLDIHIFHEPPEKGLMGVSTGKYDAFITDLSEFSSVLSFTPITNIKVVGELPFPSDFAMAAGPHISEIIPILDKALDAIPVSKKDIIWKKWFKLNIDVEKKAEKSPWFNLIVVAGLILLIIAVFIALFFQQRFQKIKRAISALDPHLLSLNIDQNITITEVTEALCKATGYNDADLVGKPLVALGSPVKGSSGSAAHVWNTIKKGDSWKGEVKIQKKDGSVLWTEAIVSPLKRKNESNNGYKVIYQDVSQKKHFEKLAVRDELTGLFNRRYFNQLGPAMLKKATKNNRTFALIMLDVDNFKKYNDNYGHPAGDKVLTAIGRSLRTIFKRSNDMVFRLGGEEFGALVIVSSPEDAVTIAKRILKGIRDLNFVHEYNPPGIVTVSIGIKTVNSDEKADMESIYKQADHALYKAKEGGRDRISL